MKNNKKKYLVSRQTNMLKPIKKAKAQKEYIIIAYIIGTAHQSIERFTELRHNMEKVLSSPEMTRFGNLVIKNILIADPSSDKVDIKLVYPNINNFETELNEYLSINQKRKLKIFKFLDEQVL